MSMSDNLIGNIVGGSGPNTDSTFTAYVHNVIVTLGDPSYGVYTLVSTFAIIAGFILLMVGLHRLTKHGRQQQMFRYHSPLATCFYILSGCALISYAGFFQMISLTLFNQQLHVNPLEPYINAPLPDTNTALEYLVYSCLIIVGIVSLIRGMMGLIRLGEGQGGGLDLPASLAHIFAGAVALNSQVVLAFFGIWSGTGGS